MALELVVLFHDGRHLPFSHMMEEVFADLNWGYKSLPIAPNIPVPYPQGVFPELQELKEKLNGKVMGIDVVKILKNAEALQIGRSGVPWLEAIVDSALDADKIEYIFYIFCFFYQYFQLRKKINFRIEFSLNKKRDSVEYKK